MENNANDKKSADGDTGRNAENAPNPVTDDNLASPRSGGMPTKKPRSRSPSENFMVAASPPRFISIDELMQAADSVSKMSLVHEISVDQNFKLEKHEPPEKSLERQVKETVMRAFWDSLRARLEDDPPDYSQALDLLGEVKEMLLGLLLSNMNRIRRHIEEHLDVELIKQQLEHGVLDLKAHANFVIDTMAQMCAPVRDDTVAQLKKIDDPVDLYKEIFSVLELMKMDMANFTISHMRPYIQQQSVTYERAKFHEFLEAQKQAGVDGLTLTRHWLETAVIRLGEAQSSNTSGASLAPGGNLVTPNNILTEAYLELVKWDYNNPLPETMVMDESRLASMSDLLNRLTLAASLVLITIQMGGSRVAALVPFKTTLKEHVFVILQDAKTPSDIVGCAASVADQLVVDLNKQLENLKLAPLDDNRKAVLITQLKDCVCNDQNPVRKLIRERILGFVKRSLFSATQSDSLQLPPGLSTVERDLSEFCGALLRVLAHNRSVFGPFYAEIIQHLLKPDSASPRGQPNSSQGAASTN